MPSGAVSTTPRKQESDVAKVRFIGDPNQREHRDATEFAGVTLPLREWVEMDDAPARKLSCNDHFEVAELVALPLIEQHASEIDKLRADFKALADDREALIEAYEVRGENLQSAYARIAELESQLAALSKPAEGESNGDDSTGTGEAGAAKAEGAGRGANRKPRGSADS
jgi:hypothetical protein